MKAVLMSIKPKWCSLIASGEKTIEVRKSKPKLETPFKVYIYCTVGDGAKGDYLAMSDNQRGKVIGEFTCDYIHTYWFYEHIGRPTIAYVGDPLIYDTGEGYWLYDEELLKIRMSYQALIAYGGKKDLYGWCISNVVIYDEPKELFDFLNYKKHRVCLHRNCFSGDCWCCPNNAIIVRAPQSWCYCNGDEENEECGDE